jgi:hypothetical protein
MRQVHRCTQGGGGGGGKGGPGSGVLERTLTGKFSKNLVKVWDPLGKLIQKAFDLHRDFGKNLRYPLLWIINCVQVLIYA